VVGLQLHSTIWPAPSGFYANHVVHCADASMAPGHQAIRYSRHSDTHLRNGLVEIFSMPSLPTPNPIASSTRSSGALPAQFPQISKPAFSITDRAPATLAHIYINDARLYHSTMLHLDKHSCRSQNTRRIPNCRHIASRKLCVWMEYAVDLFKSSKK
jgi:hypothetical protein